MNDEMIQHFMDCDRLITVNGDCTSEYYITKIEITLAILNGYIDEGKQFWDNPTIMRYNLTELGQTIINFNKL